MEISLSFSGLVKEELARITDKEEGCLKAELSAILHMNGSLHLEGNSNFSLYITTENPALVRKIIRLSGKLFGLKPHTLMKKSNLNQRHSYLLTIDSQPRLYQSLNELGILNDDMGIEFGISPRIIKKECCYSAYMRGAFLASGFISDPSKGDYELEIYFKNRKLAEDFKGLLEKLELNPRITARKGKIIVYLKDSAHISEFLIRIGAHRTLFAFEDVKIVKGIKNSVNRMVNCETANLKKTVTAAQKQIRVIEYIDENYGLHVLPRALQEIAHARLEHPELNIKELGEICEPQLSKSAVYHRLNRINNFFNRVN